MGYLLEKFNSVKDEKLNWQGVKLAEECGEVCQAICKHKGSQFVALECMDVIQCAENILRKIGYTDIMYNSLIDKHNKDCKRRGYIVDENS